VTILESRVDKSRGIVTSGIVRCGTLAPNQIVVTGLVFAKVRWIFDSTGKSIKEALLSRDIQ